MKLTSCGICSYDTNEGMKLFCIAEMFLALFNLIVSLSKIPVIGHFASGLYKSEGDGYKYVGEIFWVLFVFIFMITLLVQVILAPLLYFLGWKKKSRLICLLWIIFAALNFVWPWVLLVFSIVKCQGYGLGWGWDYYLLYLLYPLYGIWIVLSFMKEEIGRRSVDSASSSPSRAKTTKKESVDEE